MFDKLHEAKQKADEVKKRLDGLTVMGSVEGGKIKVTANGNKVDIWTCNGTGAQKWTFSGGALSVLGKCLDDASQGGAGAKLVIWTCNGHKAQTWTHRANGEYVLKLNGLCLTDPNASSVDGTQVVVRTCRNFADQHWSLPSK